MSQHPSVRTSFFVRFLLFTVLVGNLYLLLQSAFHTINVHALDNYLRWYGFNASSWFNLILLAGTSVTLWGALKIYKNGIGSYKIYFLGKVITCVAFLILMIAEYKNSSVAFPFILVPVLIAVESIYPILLYISLRKRPSHG
jgi:hypothetical protein